MVAVLLLFTGCGEPTAKNADGSGEEAGEPDVDSDTPETGGADTGGADTGMNDSATVEYGTSGWTLVELAQLDGVGTSGPISDRNGDGRTDLILPDGAVIAVPIVPTVLDDLRIEPAREWEPSDYTWSAHDLSGDAVSEFIALYDRDGVGMFVSVYDGATEESRGGQSYVHNWQVGGTTIRIVRDVTGDGVDDFEAVEYYWGGYSEMSFLLPDADGRYVQVAAASSPGPQAGVFGLGDLDGDGTDDIAVVHDGVEFVAGGVSPPPGAESLAVWSDLPDDSGYGIAQALGGDFDGDGVEDVIVSLPSRSGFAFLGFGPITSGDLLERAPTVLSGDSPRAADANGDGITDLAWRDGDTVRVAMGPLAGPAVAVVSWAPTAGAPTAVRWVGDQDGDGISELVATWYDAGPHLMVLSPRPP
jgi:hypothetical protein